MAKQTKPQCESQGPICSGELVRRYSVNGSEKEGKTFLLCGPCRVYIARTAKVREAPSPRRAA